MAISTIAAAAQRNLWIVTDSMKLYPNLYTILVAPPGVGKGKAIAKGRELLTSLAPAVTIAHSSLTAASLVDNLNDAVRRHMRLDEVPAAFSFNSLAIVSSELGVLLPSYDLTFMNTLQDLYDCGSFSQKRRGRDLNIEIPNAQLNILAACTPAYLQSTLPEGAWAEGFTSRCLFVYSGEQIISSLFQEDKVDEAVEMDTLKTRLKEINNLYGRMTFTREAAEYADAWHMGGREPVPLHPRLFNYNTRRTVHMLKIAMVLSLAENSSLQIERHHVEGALEYLLEVEHYIPDIFRSMDNTLQSQTLKDVWYYVFNTYRKENQRPVSEARVINYVAQRVPAHQVRYYIEVLEKANYLKKSMDLSHGAIGYVPSAREV